MSNVLVEIQRSNLEQKISKIKLIVVSIKKLTREKMKAAMEIARRSKKSKNWSKNVINSDNSEWTEMEGIKRFLVIGKTCSRVEKVVHGCRKWNRESEATKSRLTIL